MLLPSARPLHQDTTQPLHYRPRSQSIFQTNEKSCLDALGFFFLHLLLISPKAFPEYQSVWGRDVAQCAVSSAGPLWGGRARPGPGADLGSAQEAELTPPLLSYSPSAKHRVSWVNKNPTSKEFQVLPSDSKKVAKTTARLLWSGGPEVGGGSRRGGRGGEGGHWLLGWVRPAGGKKFPDQVQDGQTVQGGRSQSKLLPGCGDRGDRSFCMRRTPCSTARWPRRDPGKQPMLVLRGPHQGPGWTPVQVGIRP